MLREQIRCSAELMHNHVFDAAKLQQSFGTAKHFEKKVTFWAVNVPRSGSRLCEKAERCY